MRPICLFPPYPKRKEGIVPSAAVKRGSPGSGIAGRNGRICTENFSPFRSRRSSAGTMDFPEIGEFADFLSGHEPCFSEGRTGFPAEILPDPGFRRSFMFRPGTGPFHGRVRFFHPGFRSRRKRAAAGGPHAAHQFFIGFPSFTFLLTKTGILFNN